MADQGLCYDTADQEPAERPQADCGGRCVDAGPACRADEQEGEQDAADEQDRAGQLLRCVPEPLAGARAVGTEGESVGRGRDAGGEQAGGQLVDARAGDSAVRRDAYGRTVSESENAARAEDRRPDGEDEARAYEAEKRCGALG
jgi:hypothetical protein